MTKRSHPMTPVTRASGPGRLSAGEAARLPERLLDAAQAVFLEQGYARATMDAVARAAGTTRKTLYARYASKSEVMSGVVERLLDDAVAPHQALLALGSSPPDAQTLLAQVARELAQLSAAPRVAELNRLILAEANSVPELGALFGRLYARAVAGVRECLELLQAEGRLHLRSPDHDAAVFIEMVASLPRLRALLGQPMSDAELDAGCAHAVDVFLHGCAHGRRGADAPRAGR